MKPLKRQPKQLAVTSLYFWPVTLSSEQINESGFKYGKSKFGNRRQFLLDDDILNFDVWFTLADLARESTGRRRGRSHKIIVKLIDSDRRKCVVSSTLNCKFKASTASQSINHCRVSLPVDCAELAGSRNFKITVADASTGLVLAAESLALFDRAHFDEFYDQHEFYYYRGAGAAFTLTDSRYDDSAYVVIDSARHDFAYITIWLETASELLDYPEVQVSVCDPEGNVRNHVLHPDDDYCSDLVEAAEVYNDICRLTVPVYNPGGSGGIFRVEVECFGMPVATFFGGMLPGCQRRGLIPAAHLDPCPEISLNQRLTQWFGLLEGDELTAAAQLPALKTRSCGEAMADPDEPSLADNATDASESAADADDVFERLLDEFISSQLDTSEPPHSHDGADDDDGDDGQPSPATGSGDTDDEADQLAQLVGLGGVKQRLQAFKELVVFNKRRSDHGLPSTNMSLHSIFMGAPGTGKTTVARILGHQLKKAGVLSKGHVVTRERATLLGQNYSSESENTLKAIEEAQGGILFIDEAYQLNQPNDPRDPGRFVIETLLTALSDHTRRDWMLVLAGYTEPMKRMLEINPGFRSRIPESNVVEFTDYSSEELGQIADGYFEAHRFVMTDGARRLFNRRVAVDSESRDDKFGNGRYVINLIESEVLPAMARRVSGLVNPTVEQLSTIEAADIPQSPKNIVMKRKPIGFAN